jgi:hypothetical protein
MSVYQACMNKSGDIADICKTNICLMNKKKKAEKEKPTRITVNPKQT